jgi:hypothetical protein
MTGSKRVLATLCMLAIALAMLSGTVFGSVASYGANYSQDLNSRQTIKVCDGEYDGDSAYTNYVLDDNTSFRLEDFSGPGDKCPVRSPIYPRIFKHQVCENLQWQPDPCSDYIRAS